MTMEFFGVSDIETFSETSSDDQDDIFSMYGGHAQSILSSLEDSIGKIDDFLSFERGFMHGDVVRLVGNPSGQMGRIVNVEMLVDLENVSGEIIKNISSSKLLRMRSILVGDYVIQGPWIGRVEKVTDNVKVLFDDGTKCEIMENEEAYLVPISPNLLDDLLYPYHQGQRVKVESKPARWLHGISRKRYNEGTIYSVDVGMAHIDWISSAMAGFNTPLPPPPPIQDSSNFTLFSCFPHSNWQLGEWCILPSSDDCSKVDDIFSIVRKKVKVDVIWQDGNFSIGLDSQSVFPVSIVNSHDFFPGQFVLEKTSSDDLLNTRGNQRWGVVRSVDANEQTVNVKWRSTEEIAVQETVSAYELVEHTDFSFNVGDIVFRSDVSMDVTSTLEKEDCGAEFSGADKKHFLSSIGYVLELKDGDVEVQWASGVTSKVAPYEVFCMEKEDISVASPGFQAENVAQFHEAAHPKGPIQDQDIPNTQASDGAYCQIDHKISRFLDLSQAAMGFFTSIATNFFGSQGSTSLPQPTLCAHVIINEGEFGSFDEKNILESCDMFSSIPTMAVTDFDAYGCINLKREFNESLANTKLISSKEMESSEHFRQFDVLADCSDNHFADDIGQGTTSCQMKKDWLKKVQQEWSILEKDLPETIYVRIYEERMDLLRAAIVGAPGTPYHDGLFFFDIFLPPQYPHVPPLVHYHSGGLRLNPNLYESGKVCLSLLNTWTGSGSEVWNPKSSTILQVLLSLQALVLNSKPYFNEAGYDKQIGRAEGEKNSVSYNENAYLGTCKSMLFLLRNPPKHFEALIEEHFAKRSLHILLACKAYKEGTPIGFETRVENEKGNSTGFKIMLAKLFPKLVEAFSRRGIDCGQFIEPEK